MASYDAASAHVSYKVTLYTVSRQ